MSIMLPKAILFDMGDTIILQKNSDFLKGTAHLMSYGECHGLSPEDVQSKATNITKHLASVQNENHVDYTCYAFQKYLFESFGIHIQLTKEQQEIEFNRVAFERELIPGILEFLDFLKDKNIRVAILSNTTFSENTLRDELSLYDLEGRFEFVMATSEYIYRKPDEKIFQVALKKLGLQGQDVWYIGNSFHYDVIGAHQAGLYPIWLNHQEKDALAEIPYTEVKHYHELVSLIGGLI